MKPGATVALESRFQDRAAPHELGDLRDLLLDLVAQHGIAVRRATLSLAHIAGLYLASHNARHGHNRYGQVQHVLRIQVLHGLPAARAALSLAAHVAGRGGKK